MKRKAVRILPENVRYLVFEGGGGKGAAYQGVFEELTKVGLLSKESGLRKHKIFGVAGASAGGLTALYIALGYNTEDFKNELKEHNFHTLLDDAKPGLLRGVRLEEVNGKKRGVPYVAHWGPAPPNGQPWSRPFDRPDPKALSLRDDKAFDSVSDVKMWLLTNILLAARDFRNSLIPRDLNLNLLRRAAQGNQEIEKSLLAATKELRNLHPDVLADTILRFFDAGEQREIVDPYVKKIFGNSRKDLAKRVHALGYDRGLFSGFELRNYCAKVIAKRLSLPFEVAASLTFSELEKHTRIDLCVSGTNITQRRSAYFSKRHTPAFPVADAVALSMSLPFVFKPVLVHTGGPANEGGSEYAGLWVDGGILNNLPIHAFDEVSASSPPYAAPLNMNVLAFRLFSGSKPTDDDNLRKPPEVNGEDKDPLFSELFRHVGDLLETLLMPSEAGQIRTAEEDDQTIKIYAGKLSTYDFSGANSVEGVTNARTAVEEYFRDARAQVKGRAAKRS